MNLSGKEVPPEDLPDNLSGQPVPAEDLPDSLSGTEVPPEDLPVDHSTSGQQVLTAIEGLGRGLSGGLTDALAVGMRKGATALGVSPENLHYIAPEPENIYSRKEENPTISTATELGGNISSFSKLPQIGSKAINGMIQMGLIAGGDEISKAMLGHGDPSSAVAARIAEEGALGLLTGGIFGKIEKLGAKGLAALENAKFGKKIPSFLSGIAHASTFPEELEKKAVSLSRSALTEKEISNFDEKAFVAGQKFFNSYLAKAPKYISKVSFPIIGGIAGGTAGALAGSGLEAGLEYILPKMSSKYLAPAILKAAASGSVDNISHIVDHATKLSRGASKVNKVVEGIFKAGEHAAFNFEFSESEREKLRKYVEEGGVDQEIRDENIANPEGYAKGGMVEVEQPDEVSRVYPEQHVLLSSAKARISGYLNSARPTYVSSQLPFDKQYKDDNKEREYNKVLDLANRPLSILNHVKKGTLLPKHMTAFTQMYPELYQDLSKKLTAEMMKSKVKGAKKPGYKTRQALSLFLGASLDSTMTPMGIQAAQNVFAQQRAQKSMASNAAISKLDDSARTSQQSREKRQNKD